MMLYMCPVISYRSSIYTSRFNLLLFIVVIILLFLFPFPPLFLLLLFPIPLLHEQIQIHKVGAPARDERGERGDLRRLRRAQPRVQRRPRSQLVQIRHDGGEARDPEVVVAEGGEGFCQGVSERGAGEEGGKTELPGESNGFELGMSNHSEGGRVRFM